MPRPFTALLSAFLLGSCADRPPPPAAPPVSAAALPAVAKAPDVTAFVTPQRRLDASGKTTCLVRDGKIYCFGNPVGVSEGYDVRASFHPTAIAGVDDAVGVTLGPDHACVLRRGGTVACWGVVDDGTRGQKTKANVYVARTVDAPEEVVGLRAVLISAGKGFTCAVRAAGDVVCWGLNSGRALADDASPGSLEPRPVPGVDDAVEIVANNDAACARRRGGEVLCWGNDSAGLVIGRHVAQAHPIPVLAGASGLAFGGRGGLPCVKKGSQVMCDGSLDAHKKLQAGPFVAFDLETVCTILADGQVACEDSNGQRSDPGVVDAVELAAGNPSVTGPERSHLCALLRSDALQCWGDNRAGQSGQPFHSYVAAPTRIAGISDAVRVALAQWTVCVVGRTGQVTCWGQDGGGEMGDGWRAMFGASNHPTELPPQPVPGVEHAVGITGLLSEFCAVIADGSVVCWGEDPSRWRPDCGSSDKTCWTPLTVKGVSGIVDMAAGSSGWCGRSRAGGVTCWGLPRRGPKGDWLGSGPAPVAGLRGVTQIAAGRPGTCAVRRDGTAACMRPYEDFIFELEGAHELAAISVGGPHHALSRSGELREFMPGPPFARRPGAPKPSFAAKILPTRTDPVLKGVKKVVETDEHTCAILRSGELDCWDGDEPPLPVGISDAVDVAMSPVTYTQSRTTCAVRANGEVLCWGDNALRQCAMEPGVSVAKPTEVALPAP